MKNRNEIETSIIYKFPEVIDLRSLGALFRKKWDYLIVKVDYLFGEEGENNGFDLIKKIDGSKDDAHLHFFLTTFSGVDANGGDEWVENYSTQSILDSDKKQWGLAFAGMYFLPDNESWCGIYIDNIGQDIIVLGGESFFIKELKNKIPPRQLLEVDELIKHPGLSDLYE